MVARTYFEEMVCPRSRSERPELVQSQNAEQE